MKDKKFTELTKGERNRIRIIISKKHAEEELSDDEQILYDKFAHEYESAEKRTRFLWPIIIMAIISSALILMRRIQSDAAKENAMRLIQPPDYSDYLGEEDIKGLVLPKEIKEESSIPRKQIEWVRPQRKMTDAEKPVVGNWIATVGDYATKSDYMALSFGESKKVDNIIDLARETINAIKNDSKLKTNCIWLEFYDDFTGYRNVCALMNDEPTLLEGKDIITGEQKSVGVNFEWYRIGDTIKLSLYKDLNVTYVTDTLIQEVKFNKWDLRIFKVNDVGVVIEEYFPEYDYVLPNRYLYEIFSGYLDSAKNQ